MGLSSRDNAVLQFLFDPLVQSPDQVDQRSEGVEEEVVIESWTFPASREEVTSLEVRGVQEARQGNYTGALNLLNEAIRLAPTYCSLYNNRAQVHRLCDSHEEAKADLDEAIRLSDPHPDTESPANLRVAKLAYAHRGFLLKATLGQSGAGEDDLQRAAKLGHTLAALETNPFRTLCGDMVSIMMREQCGIEM